MRFPGASAHLRIAATGPVAAEVAWRRYAEPARWPGWSPQLRRVDYPHPVIVPGTGGRVVGPLGVWADFRIEDVDVASRTWVWVVGRGPVRVCLEHGVEDLPGRPVDGSPDGSPDGSGGGSADGSGGGSADGSGGGGPVGGSRTWLVLRGPAALIGPYAPVAFHALHRLVTLPEGSLDSP